MSRNPFDLFVEEYEEWFRENGPVFFSELLALKELVPREKTGLEIGAGSGIFAEPLHIQYGIDPAGRMLSLAKKRNITVTRGIAEHLPYRDNYFDYAVFITSLCFINDPVMSLREAGRVLKENGELIVAFIDKESFLGITLHNQKNESKFFRTANFYSVPEMTHLIESNNFRVTEIIQTVTHIDLKAAEEPREGFGEGCFVVIRGIKTG